MELHAKLVRSQLNFFKPLAENCSLELTRKGQDKLGELMSVLHKREVYMKDHDFGAFQGAWVMPKDERRSGVILYLHGGGYTCGSLEYAKGFAATLASQCGVRVFCAAYRLAPENPYPAAVDDALEAYRYLLKKGYAPRQILLCGESAGGGLIYALCLRLRQEVEKLAAYHGYTGKILKEDIEALVAPTVDANVFQLGDKVLRGDFNGAMAIVDDLLFLQERPESILTILTMSFVDYYRAAAVRRAGVADATARKELGYGGSYRFTKALEQCGRLSRPALEGSLEILADADARMKQSAADGRTVLEVTILRLIELLRRERA